MVRRLFPTSLALICLLSVAALLGPAAILPVRGLSPDSRSPAPSLTARPHLPLPAAARSLRSVVQPQALPTRWDWRDQDKVSPVKDQEGCDAGYAFAAVADLESKMLMAGLSVGPFSENQAKECSWEALHDNDGGNGSCVGGTSRMVANLFSQQGAVLESCDPWEGSDVPCQTTCPSHITVLDWSIISRDQVPDTATLKSYIYNYGPVQATMYSGYDDPWYETFTLYGGQGTLYYPGTEEPNHSVLIVGWDDNLSHENGTGGWIVKNSVGNYWGDGGYFTIAYGSASIGKDSSFFRDWQDYDAGGELLYYDAAGWTDSFGFGNNVAWGLCRFTPQRNAQLTRVEFWTTAADTEVDVYVYDSWLDGLGPRDLLSSKSGLSYAEAGYHSVLLDQALPVVAGEEMVIAVQFANSGPGYVPPVPVEFVERPGSWQTNRTYISPNGADGSWEDVGSQVYCDVAIRVRLAGAAIPPTATPTVTPVATATATPTATATRTATATVSATPVVTPTATQVSPQRAFLPVMQRGAQ